MEEVAKTAAVMTADKVPAGFVRQICTMGYTTSVERPAFFEYELLKLALSATDPEGSSSFFLGGQLQRLQRMLPNLDADAAESNDAGNRLRPIFLGLRYVEKCNLRIRGYRGGHESNAFCYGGTLYLKRSEFTHSVLEPPSGAIEQTRTNPIGVV